MKTSFMYALFIISIFALGCSDNPVETNTTRLLVSDIPVHFSAPAGGPGPSQLFFNISSSSDEVLHYTVSKKSGWLQLINNEQRLFGDTPDSISMIIGVTLPDLLDYGTYYDTIAITTTTVTQDTIFKEIILNIGTEITTAPLLLEFNSTVSGPNPPVQTLDINSTSSLQFEVALSHESSWLQVPVSTFHTGSISNISITADISGLPKGTYVDTIWISSDTALNSPYPVQVTTILKSWVQQVSPRKSNINDLFFADALNGWAVGDIIDLNARSGFIIRTTDGGQNWEEVDLLFGTEFTDSVLVGVTFVNNRGWIAGSDGIILYSDDFGATWNSQTHPLDSTVDFRDISFITADSGWIVGDSGMIMATSDGGLNWAVQDVPRNIDNNFMTSDLTGISFVDNMHGWVAGLTDIILVTSDGGQTWSQQTLPDNSYDFKEIDFVDLLNGWAVGKQGLLVHTTDGGLNWSVETIAGANGLLSLFFINETTGWLSDESGMVYRTIDGITWTELATETTEALQSIFFIDQNIGWIVGGKGTIIYTTSGGE